MLLCLRANIPTDDNILCLDSTTSVNDLEKVLYVNKYSPTAEDAHFAAVNLTEKLRSNKLSSLYELYSDVDDWYVDYNVIDSIGSPQYKKRLEYVRQEAGVYFISDTPVQVSSVFHGDKMGGNAINVKVFAHNHNDSWINGFFSLNKTNRSGVIVRLLRHYINSDNEVESEILGYIKTDSLGCGAFCDLNSDFSYSVLPIKSGCLYGEPKGTHHSKLDEDLYFEFSERQMSVPIFSKATLNQMKSDGIIVIRDRDEFLSQLTTLVLMIICFWWFLFIVSVIRKKIVDARLLAAIMTLSGVGVIVMSSLNNPYTDSLLGVESAKGVLIGCAVCVLLTLINPARFYQNKYTLKFDLKYAHLPKGSGYAIIGLLLTVLLFTPLGSSVGGMKVNLNVFGLKFQPSEIVKFLIVVFMSAFFCANSDKIVGYSRFGNVKLSGHLYKSLSVIVICLVILMSLYFLLGDMGPALVIAFTFICLYSIVKSKLEKNSRAITCDLATMFFGILTFCLFVYIGDSLSCKWLFCILWFSLWFVWCIFIRKRLCESAVLFNLVIVVFMIGGSLGNVDNTVISNIGNRLEDRMLMSNNTWGVFSDSDYGIEPTSNSQVADGLWGIASGGAFGQGLCKGYPKFIPAFYTDMIMESVGEQLGFCGVVFILFLYFVILRRCLVIGYKSKHPFSFFFCVGVTVVTSVQLFCILLGGLGVIPLTGVTVPFLSYGKVSIIFNIISIGIVLSISADTDPYEHKNLNSGYNYPISILSWGICLMLVFVAGVFCKYQLFLRDDILVKPLFVKENRTRAIVKYNPRIAMVTEKMPIGDIYDRKGALLATSDKRKFLTRNNAEIYDYCGLLFDTIRKEKRYYPFDNHLFFMLGDYNTGHFIDTDNKYAIGYLADSRHLSELRGYDNVAYDKHHNKRMLHWVSDNVYVNRYMDKTESMDDSVVLRDYSAVLPYLKNPDRIEDMHSKNNVFSLYKEVKPKDIHLTIDATLQTMLQKRMSQYVSENISLSALNRLRISAVILDAKTGDLLCSANYPLPDEDFLYEKYSENAIYNDYQLGNRGKAYTDRDLGLTFATAPGSTAKIISAIAAFNKLGVTAANIVYDIAAKERIEAGESEPKGKVTMEDAIVMSSNCYFIKLVNENNLYDNLHKLYASIGANVGYVPYERQKRGSAETYYRLMETADKPFKLNRHPAWQWSWGQGTLSATPVAMARLAAGVVNDGNMPDVRYVMTAKTHSVKILSAQESRIIRGFMKKQADARLKVENLNIGGKTGTPERVVKGRFKMNDAWYNCYIDNSLQNGKRYSIAVRMERLPGGVMRSEQAMKLVKNVVIPVLRAEKYFD